MPKPYKLLICRRSTGQVLNIDTKTLFSGSEEQLPFLFFNSFTEAEAFAQEVTARISNLEVAIYEGAIFLNNVCSQQ